MKSYDLDMDTLSDRYVLNWLLTVWEVSCSRYRVGLLFCVCGVFVFNVLFFLLFICWPIHVCLIGNGEQGKPFPLTENDRVDQAYRENGFNIYVSDRISLNRSLPDIRHEKWVACLCVSVCTSGKWMHSKARNRIFWVFIKYFGFLM